MVNRISQDASQPMQTPGTGDADPIPTGVPGLDGSCTAATRRSAPT